LGRGISSRLGAASFALDADGRNRCHCRSRSRVPGRLRREQGCEGRSRATTHNRRTRHWSKVRLSELHPAPLRVCFVDMTVEAIKEALPGCASMNGYSPALWLNELEYDAWDRQMVRDFSAGGRGRAVFDKVKHEIADGLASSFENGLAQTGATRSLPRQ